VGDKKEEKFIDNLNFIIIKIQDDFVEKKINFETAINSIIKHKEYLRGLVTNNKIKYEEFIYFNLFIDDVVNKIDEFNNAFQTTSGFDNTLIDYMKDGYLDSNEYNFLLKFLDNLKTSISSELYFTLKNKIEIIRTESIAKRKT
jgi:hypothetical protein